MRVLVVGAGLGGLTLARGLTKHGVDVSVYERDPGPEFRAQGARLHVDDRGLSAMRECLSPQENKLFLATLGQPSVSVLTLADVDGTLEVAATRPFVGKHGVPGAVRPGWPASRQLVRRLLAHGQNIHYGKELLRYEREAAGVTAYFADGSSVTGDVLVGADGIGSAVRRQFLPHARVIDSGVRWLGGKTPLTAAIRASGLPDLIEGGFGLGEFGPARVTVSVMRFQENPAAAAARLVPRFEPGDVRDHLVWALVPDRAQLSDLDAGFTHAASAELLDFARAVTADVHPAIRSLVAEAWPEQAYGLAMATSEPVDAWQPGNVTVLGDAIHATAANHGSGANTALQDAQRLCRALLRQGDTDLISAVGGYEEELRRDGSPEASTMSWWAFR